MIGLGRFGERLATLLADAGAEVIAIDRDKEIIDSIRDDVALAVCMNATNEAALRAQGVDDVDVAVVGVGTAFEDNVLTTVLLKQLGVPKVIARAATKIRGQILTRVGADGLVNPEEESAERWCSRLLAPSIIERVELAEGYSLAQVAAPEKFLNKTLEQIAVRQKYEVNIVAIRRSVEETDDDGNTKRRDLVISVPMADTVIMPGDVLVLIGSDEAMMSLQNI